MRSDNSKIMTKQEIQTSLNTVYHAFMEYVSGLKEEDFLFCPNQKWSAGQHLDHIYKSVQPLTLALFVPPWILKLWIGKANRPSKSYEDLVSKYLLKLSEGGRASGRFLPDKANLVKRVIINDKLTKVVKILIGRLEKYSEADIRYSYPTSSIIRENHHERDDVFYYLSRSTSSKVDRCGFDSKVNITS